MAEELRLNIVSTAESKGLTEAAKDLKETKGEADKLSKSFEDMGDNAEGASQDIDAATKSVRSHGDQIKHLREEYERTTKRIAELDAQMLDTNTTDKSGLKKDLRERRAWLAELQRIAKGMEKSSGVSIGLGKRKDEPLLGAPQLDFSSMAGMGHGALIPSVVGLVALAAPAIGAVIAGAVVGAAGVGGVVGGVIAAAHDPRVKSAWEDFTRDLSFKSFGGDKLAGPTVDALSTLRDGLEGLHLDDILGKAGPGIENLAQGVVDFATNAMPGFIKVMDNLDEITGIVADGMGNLGDATSDMLTDMMDSKGTLEGLQAIFDVLSGTLRATGEITKFLGGAFHLAGRMSAEFSGAMEDVFHWAQVLSPALYPVEQLMASINDTTENLVGTGDIAASHITFMSTAARAAASAQHDFATGLAEVDTNATSAADALQHFNDVQHGSVNNAIAFEQSLDDLAEKLKENGRETDINLQKGRDNMKAFEDAVKDAEKVRDDLLAQGKIEEANAAYKRMVDRIRDVMIQAGFTKKQIDAMLGPYTMVINVTYKERNKPSFVMSSLSEPAQDIARRASGGPVMANQPYIVGDGGRPELFVPKQNGMILPSVPNSTGSGRPYGAAVPIMIQAPAGSYEQYVIELISTAVQARGGQLAVLGLKG